MTTRRRFSTSAGAVALALLAGGVLVPLASPAAAATPEQIAACPWLDTGLSADARASALLDASTTGQKYRWLVEQAANDPTKNTFGGVTYEAQVPCTPLVVFTDGPDGVRFTPGVTAFPAPIALASTWDADLAEEKGAAQAAEAFDKGKNVVLGPGISSGRNVLSGRTAEYLGEDPLLSGVLGGASTRGLQDGDPAKPVMANVKHYVANEQELDRQTSSSNVDERTLRETYDLPFDIIVEQGEPESVMCSYNQVNGVFGCENPLLTTNLRTLGGFDGYVMSDFGAVHSTAPSLRAGLDQELNRPKFYTPALLDAALASGALTMSEVDQAAFRVVRSYIRSGLFDRPLPTTPVADARTAEHQAVSREIAETGSVLLKNEDGALPLSPASGDVIALIGPTVSATPTASGLSASTVCSMDWRGGNTMVCDGLVAPDVALSARAADVGATVVVDDGTDPARAAAVAASADVALVFGHRKSGEFTDIPDLSLAAGGDALIQAVSAAQPATVAVLETGSATAMPWLADVPAVLQAWYPGDQQGPALTALLFGDVNPSGKLPMTFPRSLAESPLSTPEQYPGTFADGSTVRAPGSTEIRQVAYSEGRSVGHRWYDENDVAPLFAFGHGLSYTSFEYSGLTTALDGGVLRVAFDVTNTGDVPGAEVPQVYLGLPEVAGDPGKRLVAFDRVELAPGETRRIELSADESSAARPFSTWDADADEWVTPNGEFRVTVGASSTDLRLEGDVVIDRAGIAPVVTLTTEPGQADGLEGWFVDEVSVVAAASDDVDPAPRLAVLVDGAPADGDRVSLSGDGVHDVRAVATDAGGSRGEATLVVRTDRAAPLVSIEGSGSTRRVSAVDATSGVATLERRLDGGAWSAAGEEFAVAPGQRLEARATDVAGNVSTTAVEVVAAVAEPTAPAPMSPVAAAAGAGSTARPQGDLAFTGGSALGALLAALGLIGAGATAVLVRRRRTAE